MNRVLVVICCLMLQPVLVAGAQDTTVSASAGFTASNYSPLIGEKIELTLLATLPAGAAIVAWPEFPSQWPPLEITNVGEMVIEENASNVIYRQTVTAILWLPGEVRTPEIVISYQPADESRIIPLEVSPAFFTIPSVLSSPNETLLPFKPPRYLPFLPPQIVVLILCPLITLAYLLVTRWRRQQEQRAVFAEHDDFASAELDRAILQDLQQIDHRAMESEAVYTAVADCLRDYLQRQYAIEAPQLTSLELVEMMKQQMPVPLAHRLQELLTQADIVKFALYKPQRSEARRYLELSARWIQAAARDIALRTRSQQDVA